MSLDEYVQLVFNLKLLNKFDRKIFLRYDLILNKCDNDSKNLDECADYCKEFNLNKYTYMFDGEGKAIERFLKKYLVYKEHVGQGETILQTKFEKRSKKWEQEASTNNDLMDNNSVFTKKVKLEKELKEVKN